MSISVAIAALAVAPALGLILGGWMIDHQLWRWIFFINLPIGVVGVALYFLIVSS